jgi:predicted 3-demethylubiquinone-9 3-methyltransferase (glyoxalase superfamily)
MQRIVPFLWFDGTAEEAARFYTGLFPGGRTGRIARYGKEGFEIHGQPEGRVMTVEFELAGFRFGAINGGPIFRFTPAVSCLVTLGAAAELDRLWAGLAEGGTVLMPLDAYAWSSRYGWLEDRYGLSWQLMLDANGTTPAITPMLLFTGAQAGQAEEAIAHYTAIFPDSRVDGIMRHDGSGPDAAGTVLHARFRLFGQGFAATDSAYPHGFGFTEANSLLVLCDTQEEIDRCWSALSAVPEAERCGWLKDRFGVSWQIVPAVLPAMMSDPDPERVARVTQAYLRMGKFEIAALERAYTG